MADDRKYSGDNPEEAVKKTHKPRAFEKLRNEFENRSWKYMDDVHLESGGNSIEVGPGRVMFRKSFKF